MRYLDIWPMSVQRPDAHLKPMIDCMHYCMPSVPNEWMSVSARRRASRTNGADAIPLVVHLAFDHDRLTQQ